MSLWSLSFSNFKRSIREYGMLLVSLAFSVFVFFNFQNVVYSDSMDVLMDYKKEYIDMIVQAASVVFGVFFVLLYMVCVQCFSESEEKGNRYLYFHGTG